MGDEVQGRTSFLSGRVGPLIGLTVMAVVTTMVLLVGYFPEAALGSNQPPAAPKNLRVGPKKWTKKNSFKVAWKNPKHTVIVGAYYKIGTPPSGPGDGIFVSQKKGKKKGSIKKIKLGKPGDHPIYVWLMDKNGNVSEKNIATGSLRFDNTPPVAPASFREAPEGWSPIDAFSVSWDGAASTDAAPIVGAYYKIGTPPKHKKGGRYVKLQGGYLDNTIDGLKVKTEGSHPIYVWLKDAAGNVSMANRVEGHLKFDKTPPEAPQELAVAPLGWTAKNYFAVSWINPDTSGAAPITGAYYKLDANPSKVDDGRYSKLTYKDRRAALDGLHVPVAGKHIVYVWLRDAAGNVSNENLSSGYLLYKPKEIRPPDSSHPGGQVRKPPESNPLDGGTDPGSNSSSPGLGEGMPPLNSPLIISAGVTRKYFRVRTRRLKDDTGRWRHGTRINFSLSKSSETIFTVVRNLSGWKRGVSCKKISRKLRKKSTKCSRFITVGSFSRQGKSGSNSIEFSGKLNGKWLRPGLYHVYVRIGGGMATPDPLLFSFRVVRG